MYTKGQILVGNRRMHPEAIHLIVYMKLSRSMPTHFVGLMLTHASGKGNIKMNAEHFTNGFIYENTHVVNAYLLKPDEWAPFRPIGNLTELGLKYIDENISPDEPQLWDDFNDQA